MAKKIRIPLGNDLPISFKLAVKNLDGTITPIRTSDVQNLVVRYGSSVPAQATPIDYTSDENFIYVFLDSTILKRGATYSFYISGYRNGLDFSLNFINVIEVVTDNDDANYLDFVIDMQQVEYGGFFIGLKNYDETIRPYIEDAERATANANSSAENANTASANANASAENANRSAENAQEAAEKAQYAKDAAEAATEAATLAKQAANNAAAAADNAAAASNSAADNANTKAVLAHNAADATNAAISEAATATQAANAATNAANEATQAATDSAENANSKATLADTAAQAANASAQAAQAAKAAADAATISAQNAAEHAEKAASTIDSKLGDLQSEITELEGKIGSEQETRQFSELSGMFWGGDMVYQLSDRFNSVIVPLISGVTYTWDNGLNEVVFNHMPKIGDIDGVAVSSGFVAHEGMKYLMITMPVYNNQVVNVTTSAYGIKPIVLQQGEKINGLDLRVVENTTKIGEESGKMIYSELFGAFWGGDKVYTSSEKYNSIVVPIYSGVSYTWYNGLNEVVFSHLPKQGDTDGRSVSSGFVAGDADRYLMITIRLSNDSAIEIKSSGTGISKTLQDIENATVDREIEISQKAGVVIGDSDYTAYPATPSFDSIVVKIKKDCNYYISDIKGEVHRIYLTSVYPSVGHSTEVYRIIKKNDAFEVIEPEGNIYYIVITLDMRTIPFSKIKICEKSKLSYKSRLYGKTIVCFGDSITEFKDSQLRLRYSDIIARVTGAHVINVGIGGSQILQSGDLVFPTTDTEARPWLDMVSLVNAACTKDFYNVDVAASIAMNYLNDPVTDTINKLKSVDWYKVDYVTIFGGTNDYNRFYGDLGASGSFDKRKTLGAMNSIIKMLLETYPHIKLVWFTPIVRWFEATNIPLWSDSGWCDNYIKPEPYNVKLVDYVDAIKHEAELNHIPCCDMFRTLGWNKYNFKSKCNDNDGTHPRKGYADIASRIIGFLEQNVE